VQVSGFRIFGIGDIEAAFHYLGTTQEDSDNFNMSAIGATKNGAASCRNQTGRSSRPVAVGCNASNTLNTLHSVMCSETFCAHIYTISVSNFVDGEINIVVNKSVNI